MIIIKNIVATQFFIRSLLRLTQGMKWIKVKNDSPPHVDTPPPQATALPIPPHSPSDSYPTLNDKFYFS